jgi:branched-chain amino acid transport system substrate-binding protein
VTKLRAARPDVLFHTGYAPDIALFLRQSKEQGFRVAPTSVTAPATARSTS